MRNPKNPIKPIRRAVESSIASVKSIVNTEDPGRPDNKRILRYEQLEDRRVLSGNGFGIVDHSHESGYVTTDFEQSDFSFQQDDVITHLKVLVNGEQRELTPQNQTLDLVAGDSVEVIEIGFASTEDQGVYAAEGYINKLGDLTSASLIDYNDGRFSGGERDYQANGQDGVVAGLSNEWIVESGWDRLTINLMHYTEDATDVDGRFFVNLQVGQPDFQFDTDHLDTILNQEIMEGDEVSIPAKWLNNLAGNFHNYAEVDIYHECDPNMIVWAGAAVGNANSDHTIEGEFVNTRENDGFSNRWTPTAPGEYILKYYVDPERHVDESNEDNNEYEIRLTVTAKPAPVAVDDVYDGDTSSINVMENDLPTNAAFTLYEEDFESDSLAWTLNPNGTDSAATGIWEATDPVGTAWNGVSLQLDDAATGKQALVTGGNDDGTVGLDDVDGGVTSAISESLSVPADSNATLSFKYTFAYLNNSSSDDYFRVSVVGSEKTTVVLETHGDVSDVGGQWKDFSFNLSEFSGQDIQILVEAADWSDASLVEAGIDDIKVDVAATPMKINEYSQGEHGSVSLNADGTFTYTPDENFEGEDTFQYTVTDGEAVSNVATVTVNVDGIDFDVESTAMGDEDSEIELKISTEYDQVRIEGVPEDAEVNRGKPDKHGVLELQASELDGLTITPAANSDADFVLTVTPGENGVYDDSLSKSIDVVVNAVVDGGNVAFTDFGIVTGKTGDMPISGGFFDRDGSESHVITINGLPDFVTLSKGEFNGSVWILDASDLEKLKISADKVEDTGDWDDFDKKNVFKTFEIEFAIESFEANGIESTIENGTFEFYTIQKKSKK